MSDSTSVIAAAVAASKDVPDNPAEVEAAGDVVGTATPEPDEPAADAPAAEEDPAPVVAEPEVKPEEADEFAREHELKTKDTMGRENRIPYSRVKRITENAVAKATAPLTQERDTLKSHNTEYVARLTKVADVEHIMFNEPARFVEILKTIPGYDKVLGGTGKAGSPAAAVTATGDIDFSQAPPPDTAEGYSAAGFQKFTTWVIQQARAQAVAEAEERLGQRFKPIEDTFTAHQRESEREQQQLSRINNSLEEGRKLPHFTTHEADILKALQEDSANAVKTGKFMFPSLLAAYHHVVFGKLTTDRQKVRESVIAEMQKTPRATSAGSSVAAAAPESGSERTTQDVIRDAIAAHRGQ